MLFCFVWYTLLQYLSGPWEMSWHYGKTRDWDLDSTHRAPVWPHAPEWVLDEWPSTSLIGQYQSLIGPPGRPPVLWSSCSRAYWKFFLSKEGDGFFTFVTFDGGSFEPGVNPIKNQPGEGLEHGLPHVLITEGDDDVVYTIPSFKCVRKLSRGWFNLGETYPASFDDNIPTPDDSIKQDWLVNVY